MSFSFILKKKKCRSRMQHTYLKQPLRSRVFRVSGTPYTVTIHNSTLGSRPASSSIEHRLPNSTNTSNSTYHTNFYSKIRFSSWCLAGLVGEAWHCWYWSRELEPHITCRAYIKIIIRRRFSMCLTWLMTLSSNELLELGT